jgi:hypothetical protein
MVWVEVDTAGVGIVTGVEIVTNLGRNGPQTMIINNGNRPIEIVNEHRHGNHQMIITTKIIMGIVKDGCHQGVNFVSLPYVYGNMNDVLHQTERCYGVGAILRMLPSTTK